MKHSLIFLILCLLFLCSCTDGGITASSTAGGAVLYSATNEAELEKLLNELQTTSKAGHTANNADNFYYLPSKLYDGFTFREFSLPGGNSLTILYDIDDSIWTFEDNANIERRADYTWYFKSNPESVFEDAVARFSDHFEAYTFDGNTYYVGICRTSDGLVYRYEYFYLYDDQFFWVGVPALGTVEEMFPYVLMEKHSFE